MGIVRKILLVAFFALNSLALWLYADDAFGVVSKSISKADALNLVWLDVFLIVFFLKLKRPIKTDKS